jgi:phenylalanine-4-hydroxylase
MRSSIHGFQEMTVRPGGNTATGKIEASAPGGGPPHAGGADELVPLDPDHPGFKDPVYRARRNAIAKLALQYRDPDPLPHATYTDEEHAVWRTVWDHLAPLHERAACREWKASSAALALDRKRVPQLADVNEALKRGAGFRMLPVAGLVSGRMFLGMMGKGVFLATQYMRHHSVPLYTPEPDVVHELVGHAASLFHPGVVKLSRKFGEAAWRVDDAALKRLELVYWYTLEFGLVEEDGALKAYGAGLLSSFGELGSFEANAEIRPLDCDEASSIPYDPTQYQKVLYASPSFDRMVEDVSAWLETQ